jgi:GntR family transcriptional regulator, transcriptional repressor for pyruvate dehydrogenase complex
MKDQKELFRPIKNIRNFEGVSESIKELIFSGSLRHGDKLPSEVKLAQQFGVGRQTIREALRVLERCGFISIKKGGGGGSVIEDTVYDKIRDLFLDSFRMGKISLRELTAARLAIERVVLDYAIDYIEEADIKSLRKNIAKAKTRLKKGIVTTEDNVEFHNLIARASRNQVFIIITESLMALSAATYTQSGATVEDSKSMIFYHEKILNAFINKDKEKAIRFSEESVLMAEKRLESTFENQKAHHDTSQE